MINMEQTAFNAGSFFLKEHELKSYDNSYPLGIVKIEDAERAIRLALSTYTTLFNSANDEYHEQIAGLEE